MSFDITFKQIAALFLIIGVGFVMHKCRVIDDTATVRYSRLILNISLPAQIIQAFVSQQGSVSKQMVLVMFGISLCAYALYAVVGVLFWYVARVPVHQRGTYLFMMMFGNVGFMGFPLIEAILGSKAMIYAVIFNVVFSVLVYSIGIHLIAGKEEGVRFDWKKLVNMPLAAAVISILLYFGNISLPGVVMRSLEFMGNITTPVAMLILGATIAGMPMRELFDEWRIYLFTIVKLAVLPLIAILCMKNLPVRSETVAGCMVILSATPVATNATMLAIEYGGDVKLASKGIFFTTILCMISIPLITAIYR